MELERFLEWYPRYRKAFSDPVYEELYHFLSSPQCIWTMAQASEAGKPALNGVVKELEAQFEGRFDFDNHVNRRMIGSMIKEILHDFGFRRKGQRMVSNTRFFSTASYYELQEDKALNTVSALFEIAERRAEDLVEKTEATQGFGQEKATFSDIKERRSFVYAKNTRRMEKELEKLIQAIDDESRNLSEKREAIRKLGSLGSVALRGVSPMQTALRDDKLAKTAVEALTRIASSTYQLGGASDIVLEFMWMLREQKAERRLMAAEALGEVGAPGASAAEALAEALRDEDEEVRKASAWALYKIGHPAFKAASFALVEALEDEDEEVREAAARALGVCAPVSVDILVELLEHENPCVCRMAAFELGRAGEYARVDSAPGLIKALSSGDIELKTAAAWALGSTGETTEGTVEALSKALEDGDDNLREKAAWALGWIGAKIKYFDSKVLCDALGDENKNVRKAAAWALGNITSHGHDPTSRLMDLLQDQNKHVREKTIWALGKICANSSRAKPAVPLLIQALSDADWAVRSAAAQSLGRIGFYASNALPKLARINEDRGEKEIVRNWAGWAIHEISKFTDG